SPLEMLLSSKSLTEFAARVQALIFVNRQDTQLANDIKALRADTAQKLDDAAAKAKEIVGLQTQIDDQKKSLSQQKNEYDRLVAEMKSNIAPQGSVAPQAQSDRNGALVAPNKANNETAVPHPQLQQADAVH